MADFATPEFLKNKSVNDIYAQMRSIIPQDLDLSEGSHGWNMTRPTALVTAELCEFILPEVIKLIFPEWSYGSFLDSHAKVRGMKRRAATAATGEITITGAGKSLIPAGSLFSTASVNDQPSVEYLTLDEAMIPPEGSVKVKIQCAKTGIIGNTAENTIIIVGSKLTGITAVTNEIEITGGTEEESDDSLKQRIDDYDKSQGNNFVGSVADYKRWAESVDGVGKAIILSAQDDSGTVTIILTDANGDPATEHLREAVYHYIMRPDDPGERLAPVNAILDVQSPETLGIGVSVTVELIGDFQLEAVKAALLENLAAYLPTAMEEQEVKLTRVASVLSNTTGVNDYKDLKIGVKTDGSVVYDTTNIPIQITQLPTIDAEDLEIVTGTV